MVKRLRNDELARAFKYLRGHPEHQKMMPPPRELKVDWFLLGALLAECEARRKPRGKLALLVGTVVRERIPDDTPNRRNLGEAYRDGIMKIYSYRASVSKHKEHAEPAHEHPIDEEPDQYRML